MTTFPPIPPSARRTLAGIALMAGLSVCVSAQAEATADAAGTEGLRVADNLAMSLTLDDGRSLRQAPAQVTQAPVGNSPQLAGKPFAATIEKAAALYKVDPALVHAVINTESGYNAHALSPKGAIGLMQLMPDTARRYGVKDARPVEGNILAGTAYLRDLLDLFKQDVNLAVAAYNAGENAVIRHGNQIPPYKETRNYVPRVVGLYHKLAPLVRATASANPFASRVHQRFAAHTVSDSIKID